MGLYCGQLSSPFCFCSWVLGKVAVAGEMCQAGAARQVPHTVPGCAVGAASPGKPGHEGKGMLGGHWAPLSTAPVRLSCPLRHRGRLCGDNPGASGQVWKHISHMLCCAVLVCDPKGSLHLLYKLKHALFSCTAGFMLTGIFTEIGGSIYLQNNHFRLCLKCSLFSLYNDIFCLVLLEAFLNKLLQLALQSLQPGRCWALWLFHWTSQLFPKDCCSPQARGCLSICLALNLWACSHHMCLEHVQKVHKRDFPGPYLS